MNRFSHRCPTDWSTLNDSVDSQSSTMPDHGQSPTRLRTRDRPKAPRRRASKPSGPAAASATNCSASPPKITMSPPAPSPIKFASYSAGGAHFRSAPRSASSLFWAHAMPAKSKSPPSAPTPQYSDGRHPDSVTFTTAEHDAQRRDFTINGLFFDPVARTSRRLRRRPRRFKSPNPPRHRRPPLAA